ncbi:MAG TPA: TetR/AcrR family transcriptional regulator [Rhizomicrobium sp.]|jgi:AcrR family transcriptional regulator|nr:TetR/AcrR family transcriptional regulator [Rhizomicrobium sp.]
MPKELSSEDFEAVRARIGAAATALYAAGGVGAITIRDIARTLGRSPMGLYRYFADREEILAFVRARAFDQFSDRLEAAFASGGDSFARARAVGRAYLDFALQNPNAYRLMFDLDPPDEAKHPDLRRAGKRAGETVTRHVKDLVASGVVHGDPKLIGNALWAAAHGVIVLHLAGRLPAGMDVEDLYFETMRLTFRGARTPASSAKVPRKSA